MSAASFSAAWLQQREPFDTAARASAAGPLDEAASARALPRPGGVLRVIDLGAGTGANLRYLAPRLGGTQHWQVLDHDAALLAAWPGLLAGWARSLGGRLLPSGDRLQVEAPGLRLTVDRRRVDLSRPPAPEAFEGIGLVTASALLDLMSAASLGALIDAGSARGVGWWFALSIDGRFGWPEPDPDDALAEAAYARHQGGDKGFGPALGPQAPGFAAQRLAGHGYRLRQAASDWRLDGAMRAAQVDGMAAAASQARPDAAGRFEAWRLRRRAGAGVLAVGHQELVALRP
ncbi:hypothetical protein V4F39_21800 [Aquincola sp. MAHUQ-54]|uniref:Class I SAM-dependent methyltransferase n=1 Tax=Aquincola agrisoli TaxID=3119538 RepID=A0AAW9QMB5_9BURK